MYLKVNLPCRTLCGVLDELCFVVVVCLCLMNVAPVSRVVGIHKRCRPLDAKDKKDKEYCGDYPSPLIL